MKVLVARMDGTTESGFAADAIATTFDVPVTRNFDREQGVIGKADISIDGLNVFAVLTFREGQIVPSKLYPALGGVCLISRDGVCERFVVLELSLCNQPNADPSILPVEDFVNGLDTVGH